MKSLIPFTLDQFFETGFHIGSIKYTKNTYSYLIGQRKNIFFFDLEQSLFLLKRALFFIENLTQNKGNILFLSITPSRSIQRLTFLLSKMSFQSCYTNRRWEGGVLSNWKKITLKRYRLFLDQDYKKIFLSKVKKRKLKSLFFFYMSMSRRLKKIKKNQLSSFRKIHFPDAVFLYNPLNISYPILETFKVGLPLIGVVDSDNIYSEKYMFPIPGNDDSSAIFRFVSYLVAFSCLRGVQKRRQIFWKKSISYRSR